LKIWIDGDACPNKIKDILFKAAIRNQIEVIIVANHFPKIPLSPFIKRMTVEAGFDMADTRIIRNIEAGDLVITADIPLAHEVVMAKALALNPRGTLYTERNIKQALAMRDFHTSLRDNGLQQSGENKLSATDIREFAKHLDRLLNHGAG
jgi:uncharacterized protein YaiI (UPF0178 family)